MTEHGSRVYSSNPPHINKGSFPLKYDNPADLFTKILSRQPFERHRKFVLNLAADAAVEQARVERQAKVDASLSLRRAHRSLYSYFRFVLPIELFGR